MAFKLKPPYKIETTPIYRVNDDPNVLGRANNNGTITINKDVEDPKELEEIKKHEETHVNQFKDFNKSNGKKGLDYGDDYIMWNGVKYPRKNGKIKYKGKWYPEGSKSFPWEAEAYKTEKSWVLKA